MIYRCRLLILPHLFILLISCTVNTDQKYSVDHNIPGDHIVSGVPFIRQKDDKYCGPAAISTIMKYYGDNRGQEQIARYVYTAELDGSLISDMRNYARMNGYDSLTKSGNLNELESLVDKGKPAILLVDRGRWKVSIPHYYVVYGYNKLNKNFIINDGSHQARRIGYSDLESEWKKMNNMMLIISK